MNNMAVYEAAIQKHDEAIHQFQAAQRAYRALLINDDGFLKAKAAYDAATAEFDAAYQKVQGGK